MGGQKYSTGSKICASVVHPRANVELIKKPKSVHIPKIPKPENTMSNLLHDHSYPKKQSVKVGLEHNLKFFSLNVGGLKQKLIAQDFGEEINLYDIACLSEIKMDLNDLEVLKSDFENFDFYSNIEEEYSFCPRGGILVLVKKHLESAIKPSKTKK